MKKFFSAKNTILRKMQCCKIRNLIFFLVLGLKMHHQRRAIFTKTCVAMLDETILLSVISMVRITGAMFKYTFEVAVV